MFERYTLATTRFPTQSFGATGCDYFVFPTPGKKNYITVDIHYSLGDHTGIHSKEVDLLNFKAYHDLPSWYPIFEIPHKRMQKFAVQVSYVYVTIIYIDLSPDPDPNAPYVYNEPREEFLRHLFDGISGAHYISDDSSQDRQESSISSQSVEHCLSYENHNVTKNSSQNFEFLVSS